jgi:Subtilase family
MRNWCSALFLVPLSLLASHAASAASPVGSVSGAVSTGTFRLPANVHLTRTGRYTRDLCDHTKTHYCMSQVLLPEGWKPGQSLPPRTPQGGGGGGGASGMGPTDVLAAYNIPASAAANGKIVAILDGPDSNAASDLAAYRSQYGLPALPKCSGNPTGTLPACFAQVGENGGASTGQDSGEDSDAETSLDMDMISAACPDCSILLVEIGDTNGDIQDSDFTAGVQAAIGLGAVATSISIGGPEEGNDPTGYTTPGHLVLAASGDFGYDLVDEGASIRTPSYPASAPDIIAVGGTTLFANGSTYDEAVWNDGSFTTGQNGQDVTTSGCSTEYAMPSWQATALSGSSCSKRATSDLSAAAAFYSGGQNTDIAVYQQGWQAVEGTSASSPMVAGILTRLGLAETISSNLGWIYTNASAFNDLGSSAYPVDSSGSNTDSNSPSSCGILCTVGTGWDGPSGVGTPNGTRLSAAAGNPPPPPPGMDAGTPPVSTPDSGTPGNPPPTSTPDSGLILPPPINFDAGPGSVVTPTFPPGTLGASCTSAPECNSGLCAMTPGTPAGVADVCTVACPPTPNGILCPVGFSCTEGYCFSDPGLSISLPDAGAAGSSNSGSSGGCAVSSSGESSWEGLGWLSLGLVAFASRKRRAKAS